MMTIKKAAPGHDRRKHERVKIPVDVELSLDGIGQPIRTTLANLSVGGCYIRMQISLAIGMKVNLRFRVGNTDVKSIGIVVSRLHRKGNGIMFSEIDAEDRLKLKRILAGANTL